MFRMADVVNLAASLVKLGVLPHGVVFRERRPGVVILIYHRVGGGTRSDIDLPLAVFERQMAFLRQHCAISSMDALLDEVVSGTLRTSTVSPDRVVVTFDDGVEEVYTQAFPVLRRYGISATVYLATRFIEEQRPFRFPGYLGESSDGARPLTWAQVRAMVASGLVTVGAHTHTHADLTRLTLTAVEEELEQSKRLIERRLGVSVAHFAYPWGAESTAVKRLVARRFRTAVLGGSGKNVLPIVDPLALRRRPVQQSDGFFFFRLKLASFLDGEEHIRRLKQMLVRQRATA